MNTLPFTCGRRGHATRLLTVTSTAALALVLLVASPAAADSYGDAAVDQPAGDPLETIAATYRATYPDLPEASARAAAVAQLGSEPLKLALADRWRTFGGGWFDPYTATYHLAVTSVPTATELATAGRVLGITVETRQVKRSLDDLERIADALRSGDSALARAAGDKIGIDIKTNQVVAAVPADRLAALAPRVPEGVTLVVDEEVETEPDVCTSRANCDNNLRAGLVLRRSGVLWCSLGFTTRSSTGTRWVLTAGHCHGGTNGETWSNGTTTQRNIGPLWSANAINSGVVDASAIQTTNAFYTGDTTGRIAIGPSSWVPVKGSTFLLVNDVVCLSASYTNPARSGNPCATVTDTSDAQVRGMVRIQGYDACGGDSGGGWYWLPASGNRYAVALHSRSISGCNASPHRSWASPVTAFWTGLTYETN